MTTLDSLRADWARALDHTRLTATETWGLHTLATGETGPVSQAAARNTLSLARLAVSFPAASQSDDWLDLVVTQGHADYCAEYGHAEGGGYGQPHLCARCGEPHNREEN